jgi:hypothetical protein
VITHQIRPITQGSVIEAPEAYALMLLSWIACAGL